MLVWKAEDISQYLENHLDYKRKQKTKEKVAAAEGATLPFSMCLVNEVRNCVIVKLILIFKLLFFQSSNVDFHLP
jgi:hypothetical protein